ncbi:MAG: L,D-transpeptidase family protein [Desulfobacteraceae bacterium]|nr:L,D-transpeptidase family protein [Desulfobacteraceae bacterium]
MKKRLKIIILILLCFAGIFLFYRYGGSLWHPLLLKVVGKRTSEDVVRLYGARTESRLIPYFLRTGVSFPPQKLAILVFKHEKMLELWAGKSNQMNFIKSYPLTGSSGVSGPKLKQGDRQIPEGIYGIEYLNPNSRYHLSVKINYPNEFDKAMAEKDGRDGLGGNIFIHGKSATIGCIPIGDEPVEELFILVCKVGQENVKIIIAPYDKRTKKMEIAVGNLFWTKSLYKNIRKALEKYNFKSQYSKYK